MNTMNSTDGYRDILKQVLDKRTLANPRYSLRAFAKSLGITHGALGQVLRGRKHLSHERAVDICRRLKLSKRDRDYFCTLVQIENSKDVLVRQDYMEKLSLLKPLEKNQQLSLDRFRVISDWWYVAILALVVIPGFSFTAQNVAKKLALDLKEVERSIERLLRLNLVSQDGEGRWRLTGGRIFADGSIPDEGLRRFHKQYLEKSVDALFNQGPSDKVTGSETFAFSGKKVEEAKKITNEYFDRILALAQSCDETTNDAVYHLQVNCFRVDSFQGQPQ